MSSSLRAYYFCVYLLVLCGCAPKSAVGRLLLIGAESRGFTPAFASEEHQSLTQIQLPTTRNFTNWFTTTSGLVIGTYADVIALAFDYYGPETLSAVVCPMGESTTSSLINFQAAFNSLFETTDASRLTAAKTLIAGEIAAVATSTPPSAGLLALSQMRWLSVPTAIIIGVYNLDHFTSQGCAVSAWNVGQNWALSVAQGVNPSNPNDGGDLQLAIAISAFANHLGTDLFSSGHMRTPRIPLVQQCSGSIYSAGLTAQRMHDEDSTNGLPVATTSRSGAVDMYMAYGDNYLGDSKSATQRQMVLAFLNASISAVWQTWVGSNSSLIPTVEELVAMFPQPQDWTANASTPCPLFHVVNESLSGVFTLETREPLTALYVRPCTFRPFDPTTDCSGADNTFLSALSLIFPSTVAYDALAGGFISYPYSFDVNAGERTTTCSNPTQLGRALSLGWLSFLVLVLVMAF